jgi:hypothetical protein
MSSLQNSQEQTLQKLLKKGSSSDFGKAHQFHLLKSIDDFVEAIPLGDYASHKAYWGDFNNSYRSTWPGKIVLLGKTSGTDKAGAKFIPISKDFMRSNRLSFLSYMNALRKKGLINLHDLLFKQAFFMGSQADHQRFYGKTAENMSYYALQTAPNYIKKRIVPAIWELNNYHLHEVLEHINQNAPQWNVYGISGFPNWMTMLAHKIKDSRGLDLKTLWPHAKFYMYSGMDINPYLTSLRSTLGDIPFLETFVATEGFYGYQLPSEPGMRLNLGSGIFYEFLSTDGLNEWVRTPEPGIRYQLVVSTNTGLWRYQTGDTICFINSTHFKFSGRVSDTLNLMGELITADQIQRVIEKIRLKTNANIKGISILPYKDEQGYQHFWFIHSSPQINLSLQELDEWVSQENITYRDYRLQATGMRTAKIIHCDEALLMSYLKSKNKLHAQAKIPLVLPVNEPYFSQFISS